MTVYIGTSGWQYRHWRGPFYPRRVRGLDDLAFFAERFQTVELNGTFYKLPEAETFEDWASRVPDGFVFAVKASRFLTHIKRLREPEEPVERLMDRAEHLGKKLGPVLLQLPPQLRQDLGRLEATLEAFQNYARHSRRAGLKPAPTGRAEGRAHASVRVAVEFRHASWFTSETREVLERHDAALCIADGTQVGARHAVPLRTPEWRTADWGYLRFHGGTGSPASCYELSMLRKRAGLVKRLWPRGDVYAYFNNDAHGCAIRDAAVFAEALRRRRVKVSRTPEPIEM